MIPMIRRSRAVAISAIALVAFTGLPGALRAAPVIEATKDDGVPTGTRKLKTDPVTYTNTIKNTGDAAATAVQFADPDVAGTTVTAGSLTATPLAIDDVYPQVVVTNIGVDTVTSGFNVLTNDFYGYTAGNPVTFAALTISAYDATSVGGGTVVMDTTTASANKGQFSYRPAPGFTGTDSFTYTINNTVPGGLPASKVGKVTLTVSGPVIWFVNDATGSDASPATRGTFTQPFKTINAAVTASAASSNIFVYSGAYTVTGSGAGAVLKASQKLIGQGLANSGADTFTNFDTFFGITPGTDTPARPSINGTKPTLASSTGDVITLADANTIRGLSITGATGRGIFGASNINTGTVGADVLISGCTGRAFSLGSGNGNFTVSAPITHTATASNSVFVGSRTAGTVTFTDSISDTGNGAGNGILLSSNTGATIAFGGALTVTTNGSTAFSVTGGGTVTVDNALTATTNTGTAFSATGGTVTAKTGAIRTLTSTAGTALSVDGATIGSDGLFFRSISSGSAAGSTGNGIYLNNTGSAGSLTVSGTGVAGSGGTIRNKTGGDGATNSGIGIFLNNTKSPSFSRMQLNDFQNFAIRGTTVNGFTMADSVISGTNGNTAASNEGSVSFDGITGTLALSTTNISGALEDNFKVTTSTSATINLTTVTVGANSLADGNDGVGIEATGSANVTANVTGSTFTSSRGDLIQVSNAGTGGMNFTFTGNTLTNSHGGVATGGGGVTFSSGTNGTDTFTINNNTFRDSLGHGVLIVKPTGTSTLNGSFSNNSIGVSGTANSGSKEGSAVKFQLVNGGKISFDVNNNNIFQYNNFGIEIAGGGGAGVQTGDLIFRVAGNTVSNPGNTAGVLGLAKNGFHLNLGNNVSDTFHAYLTLGGTLTSANNFTGSGADAVPSAGGGQNVRLRQRQLTTVHLYAKSGASTVVYSGANNDNTAVANFVAANNTGAAGAAVANTVSTGGGGYIGTPASPPTLLFAPSESVMLTAPASDDADTLAVVPASAPKSDETAVGNGQAEVSANALPAPAAMAPAARETTQVELDTLVVTARSLWEASGLTAEQTELLRGLRFEVADLPTPRLGQATAKSVLVSRNGGGNGWFASSDAQSFARTLSTTRLGSAPGSESAGSVDLLTTLLHEMGHTLGLEDSYLDQDRESIMYGYLTKGERRLPAKGQAVGAVPHLDDASHFLTGSLNPIVIGTLPPNKDVVITYTVTINSSITAGSISSQGSVSGTGFTSPVLTDDTTVAGAANPTVTLIGIPPVITNAAATTFVVGTPGSFQFTADGQPAPTFTTGGTLPTGVTLSAAGLLSGTPAAGTGGTYTFTVTADNDITPDATQSFTLTVNQAPAITSANTTTFAVGTSGSFTVTTSGFPTGNLMVLDHTAGTLPTGVTFVDNADGTATLAGTPDAGTGGSYPITITANNGVGTQASQSFTLIVNQVAAFTSTNATTFTVGTAGSFSVTTSGFPASALTKFAGALPTGVTFTDNLNGTATLGGTPAAGMGGVYPLTLRATNGVSAPVDQSFTLTVNQAPAITSANNTTFTVGTAGSFTITTSGFPGGPTMVVSSSGSLPTGVTFTPNANGTGTLSGTPAAATGGTYTLTLGATNGVGSAASQTFTLTVNQAPAITSANSVEFTEGVAGSFTVTTTGFPTNALMDITRTGTLPGGVTFVNNLNGTATLSGTPALLSANAYPLTIGANNGVSPAASQSFTLTVKPPVDHFTVTAPANATAGTPVNVTVSAFDASNTLVPNYTGTIHFTSTDAQAGLPANYTFTAGDSGSHTFSVTLKTAGTSMVSVNDTTTVTAAGTSDSIVVVAGADNKLAFVQQPTTTVAGVSITPAVTVQVQDEFGNPTTSTATVAVTLGNPGTATLSGTASAAAVGGVATFSDLSVNKVGTTYTLGATSAGLTAATSNAFTITPAAATHFAVVAPGTATAGTAFNFTVTALDAFDNVATGYAGTAHFTTSDAAATAPADTTLTSGVGTISATLKTAGSQTLTATDTVTSSITGTSGGITVGAGADNKLVFVQQPTTTVAGVSITPAVTVQIQDTFGNPTASTATVAVALGNPGTATLTGTASVAAVNGLATFSTLKVDKVGSTYNLGATSTGLTGATSNAFTITPAAATHFAVVAPGTATAGTAFNFTVTALDAFDNVATGYAGTVHFTSSDAVATLPADATLTSGVGTLSATLKTAGSRTLTATDTVTSSITGTSGGITVGAGADNKLVFVQQPTTTVAGVSITPAVTVQIQDIFGNPTASTATVAVALGNPGTATLTGTASVAAVNGLATFSTLKVDKVGTTYNLGATSTGLTGATSNAFTITPAAATHFAVTAPGTAIAGTAFNFTVTALDAFDNVATGYAGTAHFTSSDAVATLPADATLTSGVGTLSATLKTAGSRTLTATDTVTSSITGTSGGITVGAGADNKLVFVQQPTTTVAGVSIAPAVTVLIQDAFGNSTSSTATVAVALGNPGTATLSGTTSIAAVNGVATFSTLKVDKVGSTYNLGATSTGLTGATSNAFTITPAAAAKLAFGVNPTTTVAGVSITPAVTVRILDAFDNLTPSTASVSVAIGTNAGGGTLSGAVPVNAVAGVATFSGLSINKVGTGYTLAATSTGLTGGTSGTFNITPAAATHFAVAAPGTAIAGTAFNFTVTALDAFDNVATGYAGTAHFTSSDAAAVLPADAALTSGVGTLSATLKTAGSRTLTATDTVTSSITGTSAGITVGAGADNKLVFVQQPTTTVAGVSIAPAVTVLIQDAFGNSTSSTATVAVALGNPGTGTLSGTLSKPAVAGVATFANLSVNKVGTTYNLGATSTGLTAATSNAFTITPAAATHFAVAAPGTATAGTAFNFSVTALDAFDNVATGYVGTAHFTSNDAAAVLPADATLASGVGTFSATLKTAGSRTLTATDTVTSSITGTSAGITVGAGADNKLVFVQQPSTTVAGVSIAPAVTVLIQDAFGNSTSSTATVAVALGNPGTATLSGTTSIAAVNGVATFSTLKVDKVGTTYNLGATSTGLTGATSNNFTITPAPASKLVFGQQPSTAVAGVAIAPAITVRLLDQFDNLTPSTANVALAIEFNSGNATLSGTTTVAAVGGVATFPGLSINKVKTHYTLAASSSGLTGASSLGFDITPGPAHHYLVAAPANAIAGTAFNFTVTAQDSFDNTATGYAGTVHFTSSDAPATLPANSTLTNGVGTFSATLATGGNQTITATDTVTGTITDTSDPINVSPRVDLAVTLTDSPDPVIAGTNLTYTLNFTNLGPSTAATVSLADTLPAGTTFVSLSSVSGWSATTPPVGASGSISITKASVAPLETASFTLVVKVAPTIAAGTVISNTLTASSATTELNPGNDSATATTTVSRSADLAVTMTDAPDPLNATQNVTYTIGVSNNGPSDAATVTLTDTLPANTTFVSVSTPAGWNASTPVVGAVGTVTFSKASLALGGTAEFTIVAKVDLLAPNDSTLVNTATVASTDPDPNVGNNSATTNTLVKSGADLAISGSASTPVVAGTDVTYTFTAVNDGPLDADNTVVSDVLPPGTTFVSAITPAGWTLNAPPVGTNGTVTFSRSVFADGASANFTVVAHVESSVLKDTILHNGIAAASSTLDIFPLNSSASLDSVVTTRSDLAVTNSATPDPVLPLGNVTYTLSVTNNGPSDATNVVLSNALPSTMTFVSVTTPGGWLSSTPPVGSGGIVTFTKTSLANGTTGQFTLVAKVKAGTANGTVITDTAIANTSGTDPNAANNSATSTVAVGTVDPTPLQLATTGTLNAQTGLFQLAVKVTNTTPYPINGFRLHVDFSAYKAAYPSLRLYNASSPLSSNDVYVDHPYPVGVDGTVNVTLLFYTSTRTFPSPFAPILTVEALPTSQLPDTNGAGVQATAVKLPNGTVRIEFPSIAGHWYRVRYSADLVNWYDSPVPIQAGGSKVQWIDNGAPFTSISPADPSVTSRFYIVNEIAAP